MIHPLVVLVYATSVTRSYEKIAATRKGNKNDLPVILGSTRTGTISSFCTTRGDGGACCSRFAVCASLNARTGEKSFHEEAERADNGDADVFTSSGVRSPVVEVVALDGGNVMERDNRNVYPNDSAFPLKVGGRCAGMGIAYVSMLIVLSYISLFRLENAGRRVSRQREDVQLIP